ncbi:glycosyltransferase [Candidatus Woesearchaeota archaeon]|nr:glycosyltransferase [Candidatus Woesearchaeota archaeon]
MKVMIVNKFHYVRGGAEKNALQIGELLEKKGHEVMHFSMHHPQNIKYKFSRFFAEYIDFPEEMKKKSLGSKAKVLRRVFYSTDARKKFCEALNFFQPDIIHLHNIHRHLTISIIREAYKRKIPMVWTLHDYQLICPNHVMLSHGNVCERCKHNYLAPILERCIKDSLLPSVVSATERISNDLQGLGKMITTFISPSRFLMNKYLEFGYDKNKFTVISNYYEKPGKSSMPAKDRYFLYLGRLSREKGIPTLCQAAKEAGVKLKIVGNGPLLDDLSGRYKSDKISFLGYKQGKELENLRSGAWFTIVPSECYENNPFSAIESLGDGTPVIGARIGGIPELIQDSKTGFLFESRSVKDLKEKILCAEKMTVKNRREMGSAAILFIKRECSEKGYFTKLMKTYKKTIEEYRR